MAARSLDLEPLLVLMLIPRDEPRPERKEKRPSLRLLVVEDHPDTAAATQKLLEFDGYEVRAVGTYKEALKAASEWVPDGLICDIGLPGKDGVEVLKTMRKAYPGLRGLVVSGFTAPEDIDRSLAAGFSEHLSKPVDGRRLRDAIHRLFQATQRPVKHGTAFHRPEGS